MLCFIADQIGVSDRDFEDYAGRAHLSELQAYLGVRPFRREDYRAVAKATLGGATGTDRGDAIVAVMIDHLRKRSISLPASVTLEKFGLAARESGPTRTSSRAWNLRQLPDWRR